MLIKVILTGHILLLVVILVSLIIFEGTILHQPVSCFSGKKLPLVFQSVMYLYFKNVRGKLKFKKIKFFQVSAKIQGFSNFWGKFQAFSKPGKVDIIIPGFQGLSGRVGTLILVKQK